ncbi:MAG: site-specific integrase [Spirochaetaceae bacterium]|jgi:integrase|nr:site-specific integrase [Spirochaetaceae bacterium]
MHNSEAIVGIKRHLYRRNIGKVRAWYYWYEDPLTGRKIRRSCGEAKRPVLLKRDAEAAIAALEEKDRQDSAAKAASRSVTVKVLAETMFEKDSPYLRLKEELGEGIIEYTRKEILGYLKNWIIPRYGALGPERLDPVQIQNDLLATDRSNFWRNRVNGIINQILDEAVRNKMIAVKPALLRFKRRKAAKDVLTAADIAALFPDEAPGLSKIWDRDGAESDEGFMFGTLFALMLSTGLRSGEARALHPEQVIVSRRGGIIPMIAESTVEAGAVYGLVIDRMINSEGNLVRHLKKGDEEDPRLRVAVIPEKTVGYLKRWVMIRPAEPADLLFFSVRGKRLRREGLQDVLERGLGNAGVALEGRRITPHSLRFTYNTRMRRLVPGEALRMMIGHLSEGMTDYYTRIQVEEDFLSLQDHTAAINRFWG